VLVADDEKDFVAPLKDLLEGEGYRVLSALSGEAAVQQLASETPDLILLDLHLPGAVDGWTLHAWLKHHAELCNIPVVVMSGSPLPSELRKGMNKARPSWLEKPVNPDELLVAIHEHLPLSA